MAEIKATITDVKRQAKDWDTREQGDLSVLGRVLASKTKQLSQYQDHFAKFDLVYDGAQTELRAIVPEIRGLLQRRSDAAIRIDKHNRLNKEINTLDKTNICPTCGQPVSKKDLAKHKAELEAQLKASPIIDSLTEINEQLKTLIASETKP